jgi:hypothetical protein
LISVSREVALRALGSNALYSQPSNSDLVHSQTFPQFCIQPIKLWHSLYIQPIKQWHRLYIQPINQWHRLYIQPMKL